jgi:DNA-3-methyladenine glycosylase II
LSRGHRSYGVAFTGKAFLGREEALVVTQVAVRAPFRLDLTANVLRRLSTNVVDRFDGTTYRRLIGDSRKPALLSITQSGPAELSVDFAASGTARYEPAMLVERLLGTDIDLERFYRAAATVDWLAPLVAGARGVKPPRYPSLWEACVNAIVYQQVSIHAAGAILRRVIERYAVPVAVDDVQLYAFPGAQALVDADPVELRGLGVSINKVVSLRAVARAILEGEIDEGGLSELPTPELMAALTLHRGIGPWTAAVVALRGFGRLDLFPMNDSGVARSVRDLSGGATVDVEDLLARLGEQRGMLYYHLLIGRLAARGDVELAAVSSDS